MQDTLCPFCLDFAQLHAGCCSLLMCITRRYIAQDPNSYAGKLLTKEPTLKVNFSRASAAISRAKTEKVARFLPNPEANWGPMSKHTRTAKVRCGA